MIPGVDLIDFIQWGGVLAIAVVILFIAAIAGDNVGYTFGRRLGPRIFNKPDARLFKQSYVVQAQKFYDKHGGKTILLARFVPIVRTFAPLVAGVAKMKYRSFLMFNLAGALLWAAGVTYAGYGLGKWFEQMGWKIDTILLPVVFIIILLSILPPSIHILRDKKRRTILWSATKRELRSI